MQLFIRILRHYENPERSIEQMKMGKIFRSCSRQIVELDKNLIAVK